MKLSPVILFVYNRPQHTQAVLNALSRNPEASLSTLIIFSDGAKVENEKDKLLVEEVRNIINNESRFLQKSIIQRPMNLGLAESIISGVDMILDKEDTVIVLEDDTVPTEGFLNYMNNALALYKTNDQVGCIHGWNYNFSFLESIPDTFFLKGADCWGWATWKRSWRLFERNAKLLKKKIDKSKSKYEFNRRGTHDFYGMLDDLMKGKNNSWAVRWHASLFLANKYCLHPGIALIENIGMDNSGVHCQSIDMNQMSASNVHLELIPVVEAEWFFDAYLQYVENLKKNN